MSVAKNLTFPCRLERRRRGLPWPWGRRSHAAALESLAPLLAERDQIEVFLYGSGAAQVFPPRALREALADRGLHIETMSTGAAARTYNLLLAESRAVAAALLPVP